MVDILKNNNYEYFIRSKNDIIIELNKSFKEIIGYDKDELIGRTLTEASKILRIESQVNLQDIEEDTRIFIFTKDLFAIEGIISSKTTDNGLNKIFSFKRHNNDLINEKFNLASQLCTIKGDGIALLSFSAEGSEELLINCNKYYLDYLRAPYNIRTNSIGKTIKEICPEYSHVKFNILKNHIRNTATAYYIKEMSISFRNYDEEYWDITLVPILEEEIIRYVLVSLTDVTQEVLNRKTAKLKKEELEAIFENMSDEIIIFNKDLDIINSNKLAKKTGFINNSTIQNFKGIIKSSVVFDKDNKLIQDGNFPCQRVARGEFISDYFAKIRNPLGTIYREISGSPIYDKNGNFSVGVMVYRNIDDRVLAEEDRLIKTQNELLTKVVEAMDLEFIRCTYPELEIISINGKNVDNLIEKNNKTKSDTLPIVQRYPTIYPIFEENRRKELKHYLIEGGKHSYIGYTDHIIDGEQRFFKTIHQPIFGLNNKIVEIIFITMDITDEVKVKNKMEETLEMQNQMLSSISHELKTPLSMIFSSSQLLEMYLKEDINKIKKEEVSKSINTIKQNCYRFIKLINNIIDLSSMESGFYKLRYSNENIIGIVEDIVDSVRNCVQDKGLSIIFDTEIEEMIIAVDVDKMERIILNLISNAVKFSPKNGNIYIDIRVKVDYVDIFIID